MKKRGFILKQTHTRMHACMHALHCDYADDWVEVSISIEKIIFLKGTVECVLKKLKRNGKENQRSAKPHMTTVPCWEDL